MLRTLLPKRYQNLPGQQQIMEFATLFNHTEENINALNEVLEHLRKKGKQFLLICCSERDKLYRYLKPYSINTYGYYLLSDFPISKEDIITVDVRCL